jgi:hypothetical protein
MVGSLFWRGRMTLFQAVARSHLACLGGCSKGPLELTYERLL